MRDGALRGCRAASSWHFDFYRFNDPQEWEDAGFRDVFASRGLKLASGPEKAAGLLPRPTCAWTSSRATKRAA